MFYRKYINFNILDIFMDFFSAIDPIPDYNRFFSTEISQLKEYVQSRLNNMSEYEIKETNKKTMNTFTKSCKCLFDYESKTPKVFSDEILILFFYKNLTSKTLERRIKGITYLGKCIEIIERKDLSYR